MARIKKKGLDYFPMGVEFVGSREVRRLVKREGEGAYMVLSFLISDLYGGEGYYLPVDEDYYEDLADRLFTMETDDVRRIVKSTIELGIFDNEMFMTHGILTSADIQRQYLFCAKSKDVTLEEEKYRLLSDEEMENLLPKKRKKVEVLCENNDLSSKNSENTYQSTQIKEKEIKENKTSEKESKEKEPDAAVPPKGSSKPIKEWTREDIERLEPRRKCRVRMSGPVPSWNRGRDTPCVVFEFDGFHTLKLRKTSDFRSVPAIVFRRNLCSGDKGRWVLFGEIKGDSRFAPCEDKGR